VKQFNQKGFINWKNLETEYLVYDQQNGFYYRVRSHQDYNHVYKVVYGITNNEGIFELNGAISQGETKPQIYLIKMKDNFKHSLYEYYNNVFEKMRYEEFLKRLEKDALEVCQKLSRETNPSYESCIKLVNEFRKIEETENYYREKLITVIKNIREFVRAFGEIR